MVESSEECRMLEKYMYWMEFEANRHHFFKIMTGDFRLRLRIPRKFVINFKEKLADTILLKGPSGNMWTVELTRTDDDLFFENGWEEFVQDHSLEDTNFLVFRYNGDSSFKVLIFDATGCEREGSYFVKKHSPSCSNNSCVMQGKQKEDNVEFIDLVEAQEDSLQVEKEGKKSRAKLIDLDEAHEHTFQKGKLTINEKFIDANGNRRCNHIKEKHREEKEEGKITPKLFQFHPFQSSKERRKEVQRTSSIHLPHKLKKEEEFSSIQEEYSSTTKMPTNQKQTHLLYFFNSNRREVTEEEKQRAHELATRYLSAEPSFLLTMKPTNVYKSFTLTIPTEWATKHLPCQCQEIQLRALPSRRKWAAQLKSRPDRWAIKKGWADFAMANYLEEDDACIFKPAQGGKGNKKPIILDVIIFRVVEELVPLTIFSNLYQEENSP